MFQLNILSGKMAGTVCVARHFPFRVGRNPGADLRVEESGVWENHLNFDFLPDQGIQVTAQFGALMVINSQRTNTAVLRNGDLLEIGALKLRFWLSDVECLSQTAREWITWTGLALLFACQIALIYWLSR